MSEQTVDLEPTTVEDAPAPSADDGQAPEGSVPFAPGSTPEEPPSPSPAPSPAPSKPKRPAGPRPGRATKEMFSVCVTADEGKAAWFNVSDQLGKQMPFTKPLFTCAMRVTSDDVAFSLLQVTNKMRPSIVEAEIAMPRGPMGALARSRAALAAAGALPDTETVVVTVGEQTLRYSLRRDEHGLATLDSDVDDDIELPRGACRTQVFLVAPRVGRLLSVSAIIYPGRAGTPSSLRRVGAEVLNVLSGVPEFRLLSGITGANVPAPPTTRVAKPAVPDFLVGVNLPVALFAPDENPMPVGNGTVAVTVDLTSADPAGGNVLFNLSPAEPLTEEVLQPFRAKLIEALNWHLSSTLGDELTDISYEIVLGEVGHGTAQRLQEALQTLPGVNVTPRRYMPM